MEWKLINVTQETNHPFLNYFTLTYEVEKADGKYTYSYFIASRRSKENLVSVTKDYTKADGVLIPCYFVDPRNNLLSIIITKQFRPALNTYVHSFPAGLIDKNEDLLVAAKREAEEEVGVEVDNLEIIAKPSPTSSGLSDEMNSIVWAHVKKFTHTHLEEFEDIGYKIIPFKDLEEYLNNNFTALQIKIISKYLLEKFKGKY